MKLFQVLTALVLTTILVMLSSSCSNVQEMPILDMTVLIDNTDSSNQHISYDEVRPIYDFKQFLWYSHHIRLRELSDVEQGVSRSVELPRGVSSSQTEGNRKAQVRQFLEHNLQLFDQGDFQPTGKEASYIYVAAAQELNRLATESTATNRVCIIDSDLHEHSTLFDVYDSKSRELLLYHPDSVIQVFTNRLALEDLSGVQVVIVHRANTQTNEVYSHMARLYQYMLTAKGAKVTITGSFNPSDLNFRK